MKTARTTEAGNELLRCGMTLQQICEIFGDGHFKLCEGKRAIDNSLYTAEEAQRWLDGGGTIGLWCPERFVIVDIDDRDQAEVLNRMVDTLKCKTPHGMHFYFWLPEGETIRQIVKAHTPIGLQIDTRTAGKGYCILPFNCSDREWIDGIPAQMPWWIKPLAISSKSPVYITANAKNGDGRNDSLIRQVMRLRKEKFTEAEVSEAVDLINRCVWGEALPSDEVKDILSHASGYIPYAQKNGLDFCLYSEKGSICGINHKALVDYMVNTYPMFTMGGVIYFYKDGVFKRNALEVKQIIKELIREPKYQRQGQINEIFNQLMDDLQLVVTDKQCNTHKEFINFTNGMFNIEEQRLYPHDPRYMSTIQIPHEYTEETEDGDAQIIDFLRRACLPQDDINMLLDYAAYCMTTGNGLKAFMCLVGGGNTGKSTLIKMLVALVGTQNVSALSIQDMAARFYPSQLKDKLINACADNSSLALNDIGNLKKITGDDEIMYEDKGCTPYFFTPFAKLIFSFNALPLQLEEKSDAFYNRIRILEMNHKIELNQQYVDDLCSDDSIRALIPILCKRLRGLKKVRPSKRSMELSQQLRSESDSIHAFVSTQIQQTGELTDYITQNELYEMYARFCLQDDRQPHKRMHFYRGLEAIGFRTFRSGNQTVYAGVKKV